MSRRRQHNPGGEQDEVANPSGMEAELSPAELLKQQDDRIKKLESLPDAIREQGQLLKMILNQMNGEGPDSPLVEDQPIPPEGGEDAYGNLLDGVDDESIHTGQDEPDTAEDDEEIDEELLAVLDSVHQEDDHGEPLTDRTAKTFHLVVTQQSKKEDLDKLRSSNKVPSNCKVLRVQKCNPDVWKNPLLPKKIKATDAKFQFTQQGISRSLIAIARASDMLLKNSKSVSKTVSKPILTTLVDAAVLLGSAFKDITAQRKSNFKSVFVQDIPDTDTTNSEYLFGDNLEVIIKQTSNISKLLRNPNATRGRGSFRGRGNRHHPYVPPPQPSTSKGPGGPLNSLRGLPLGRGKFQQRGRWTNKNQSETYPTNAQQQ